MSAYVCGLDVHKRHTYATLMGPDGEIMAQGKMPNEEVLGFLKPYPVEHVAMEATVNIAFHHRSLTDGGYEVHIAHPKETRNIAKTRIETNRISLKGPG